MKKKKQMKTMNKKGAKRAADFVVQGSILAMAGILVRIIGMLYRMPLNDIIGKQGNGYYTSAYNVYNILAAYAGLRTAGFSGAHFQNMLQKFNPENGRMEQFRIKGTGVMLNLAKNPAGFNQNISAVMQDKTQKDIIITINDNAQDGTDISWLWDVDFDLLGDASIHSITVSGIRCQDMRLRMKYVDIPVMLEENVETAIRKRIEDGVGNLYVLVNYTALFSTHNILKKMEGEKE